MITSPIVRTPNWELPFEVMCDASDFSIRQFLGREKMESLTLFIMQVRLLMNRKEITQPLKNNCY